MTMPNFLIIGAAKSGTSALYHYLRQHPQIYMSPRKEPHFFSFQGPDAATRGPGDTVSTAITDPEVYESLFDDVTDERAIGEASPTYIYIPQACERIYQTLPHARLIAILRHPAERAFSAFMHVVRDGREQLTDFAQALEAEPERIRQGWGPLWHYQRGGFYYEQLKRYYDRFPSDQIEVCLHEDLRSDATGLLQSLFRYLSVDDQFVPDVSVRPNVSGIPRSRALQGLIYRLFVEPNPIKSLARLVIPEPVRWRATTAIRIRNLVKAELPADIRQRLVEVYRQDILRLQDLIQRDLSTWLN